MAPTPQKHQEYTINILLHAVLRVTHILIRKEALLGSLAQM
jgi:hypothetical protein